MVKTTTKELPQSQRVPESRTAIALVPPTSLLAPGGISEAEKAFLTESGQEPEKPTKLPSISINHKGGEFVMPDGSVRNGDEGIDCFILAHFTTRLYYEKPFDPRADKMPPDCKSADCITPDSDATAPQAQTCAVCPHNAWGSARQGKGKACREYLRLIVVSPSLGNPPIAALTLPPTAIGIFYGGTMSIGGRRGYLDQVKSKHKAYQIIWTRITLIRETEESVNVLPAFTMGEPAQVDVARSLAALSTQFMAAIRNVRRDVPEPSE